MAPSNMALTPGQPRKLHIDTVAIPGTQGIVGMTLCPGHSGRPDLDDRDLEADLAEIRAWNPDIVITLMEEQEFIEIGVENLAEKLCGLDGDWHHLPIQDGCTPDPKFEKSWENISAKFHETLLGGGKILVHCRGGYGRSGTIAALFLMDFGVDAEESIRKIREARPGALDSPEQENYVRNFLQP